MLVEIALALLLGVLSGTLTGISPGIHINLVSAILLGSAGLFSGISPLVLAVFIVSMSITHTFIDFIPAVFLGAPEEDSFLSVLPGHEMLKQGKGYEAVILTLQGSLSAIPTIIIFTPLFILFLPSLFNYLKAFIPFLLLFISVYSILREKNSLSAFVVFILAGFLGFATLNLPVKEPLLPLLTGLFGLSSIIISIKQRTKIKKQKTPDLKKIKLSKKEYLKSYFASFFSAPLCSFLPGIGSGNAAFIGSEIIPQNKRGFLFLVGSINTIIMALSFITLYSINKSRSGSAAAINDLLGAITLSNLALIMLTVILSSILAFIVGIKLAKLFSIYFNKLSYKKISILILIILILVNFIFSNPLGLLVLITSASLGLFCILSNARRINLMGSLIIPAIVYYLTN